MPDPHARRGRRWGTVVTVEVDGRAGIAAAGGVHPAADRPAVDGRSMREVLGHFASGVVVVTAAGPDGPLGFTCQSFASLSLDPPLVSFAPARASRTWPQIREVGAFCVNVLAEDQAALSAGFARTDIDRFAGVAWRPGPAGAPVLDGVCAWISCTIWREYDGGDHTIVAGLVRDLAADPTRSPLLFHRGGYGLAGPRPSGGPDWPELGRTD